MFIVEYLEYLRLEKKYSPHTVQAYESDIREWVRHQNIQCITSSQILTYRNIRPWIIHLVDKKLSSRTINRKVASLNNYFKFLIKVKVLEENPLASHIPLKVAKRVQSPFTVEEIEKALYFAEEDMSTYEGMRDRTIIELLYVTGMRRSELIGLQKENLDLSNGRIKVLGKRNKERFIPLLTSIRSILEDYVVVRDEKFGMHNSYLFLTGRGVKMYDKLVYRVINSYFSKASTKVKQSPHMLRHAFATHLLNQGADLNSVKELLGHESLAATQVYTHSSIAQLSKVYKKSHPRSLD